jgi:hypothetical protein
MPFGKHRGRALSDLPDSYLGWLRDLDDLREPLRTAIEREHERRLRPPPPPPPPSQLRPPDPDLFRNVIREGYRAMAMKSHPDRGGDVRTMQKLNGLRDWCERQGLLR